MSIHDFLHDGRRVRVDRAQQVLFAELSEALVEEEYTLYPSVASVDAWPGFTSSFALAAKAKHFDDQVMACLEHLMHDGAGEHPGLFRVLERLRAHVPEGTVARALLDGARHLAGGELPAETSPRLQARRLLAPFVRDRLSSRPIGIYAESDALGRIFRHDRFLQQGLSVADAAPLRRGFLEAPDLLEDYERHLKLVAGVTGPLALPSVLYGEGPFVALVPASGSLENQLIDELYGAASVPDGFSLGRELIARIRDGRLVTRPTEGDAWYRHQLHAAAALLEPESEGLRVGPRYRADLEETFQALFALNRETHVKQLAVAVAGAAMSLRVAPQVSVEPLPEHYGRVADGYACLARNIAEVFGPGVPSGHRLAPGGPRLGDALADIEALFRGAEAVSREQLGQRPADFARSSRFHAWQARSGDDPALRQDLRVAVPVWRDVERGTVRICATLGVRARQLDFTFERSPQVHVDGQEARDVMFSAASGTILSAVTIECDVTKVPTRSELRAICEEHRTPRAIRAALEAG